MGECEGCVVSGCVVCGWVSTKLVYACVCFI